jgi:hypothetical protein
LTSIRLIHLYGKKSDLSEGLINGCIVSSIIGTYLKNFYSYIYITLITLYIYIYINDININLIFVFIYYVWDYYF